MQKKKLWRAAAAASACALVFAMFAACAPASAGGTDTDGITGLVEAFGGQLQKVSLLSPAAAQEMEENYAAFLTPALLREWMDNPQAALGREVSSPWPERIAITDVSKVSDTEYEVQGSIIYVTGAEFAQGSAAETRPVTLWVTRDDAAQWKISRAKTA